MDCREFSEWLPDLLLEEGGLDPCIREQMKAHPAMCATCRDSQHDTSRLIGALRANTGLLSYLAAMGPDDTGVPEWASAEEGWQHLEAALTWQDASLVLPARARLRRLRVAVPLAAGILVAVCLALCRLGSAHSPQTSVSVAPVSDSYVAWCAANRPWFETQFPWVFPVQQVLADRHGIQAEYVTLLMVSGNIWQFNYPRPCDRPIPRFEVAAVERIARHYDVPAGSLSAAARNWTPQSAQGDAEGDGGPPWLRTRFALLRWRAKLLQSVRLSERLPEDELLPAFRSAVYLARTAEAAQEWTAVHPDQAAKLFGDSTYVTQYAAFFGSVEQVSLALAQQNLARRIEVAQRAEFLARELLLGPGTTEKDIAPGADSTARPLAITTRLAEMIELLAGQRSVQLVEDAGESQDNER